MKLSKERVAFLSASLVDRLVKGRFISLKGNRNTMVAGLEQILTNELRVEDRLNNEVRNLLKNYEREIDHGNMDYQKLFQITKKQLIKNREIIL